MVFVWPLATARAQTVLASNLGNTSGGNFQPQNTAHWYAQQFTTTAALFSITSVTLSMANPSPQNAAMYIYTNSSGQPGTATNITFTTPANSGSIINTVFNVTGGSALSTNTTYWVVVAPTGVSSGFPIFLNYTTATSGTGSGFVSANAYFSPTSGSGGSWSVSSSGSLLFSVSAVPEPSTYALGVGVLALGVAAYRRRSARIRR